MVVSVPRCIKCLSWSETIVIVDLVGAPVISVALTSKAFELLLIGCQVKVLPFATVATKTCPKLSNDQLAGSSAKAVDREASPQPVNTSTNAPLL